MENYELIKLKENIDIKKIEIKEKKEEIDNFEIDVDNYEEQYCEIIDETNPEVFNIQPSRILRECDPTMYRCGLNDYVDSIEIEEDKDYKELVEDLETFEDELFNLKEDLELETT